MKTSLILISTILLLNFTGIISDQDVDEIKKTSEIAYKEYNATSGGVANPVEWSEDIATWVAPEELKKGCPYYIMGKDFEGRFVYVWEVGHCDFKTYIVESTPQMAKDFDKYLEQLWWKIGNTTTGGDEEATMIILDAKDYAARQLTSLEVVKNKLMQARRIEKVQDNIANPVIINLTFISQMFMDLITPLAGRFMGRIEKFSPREKWEPYLKSKIPKEHLPPYYGGDENYKPLKY